MHWHHAALSGAPHLCTRWVCGHLFSGEGLKDDLMEVVSRVLLYLNEEGSGTSSSTEEEFSVHRIEVLGGTHLVKIKGLFLTCVISLWEEDTQNCQPALSKWWFSTLLTSCVYLDLPLILKHCCFSKCSETQTWQQPEKCFVFHFAQKAVLFFSYGSLFLFFLMACKWHFQIILKTNLSKRLL